MRLSTVNGVAVHFITTATLYKISRNRLSITTKYDANGRPIGIRWSTRPFIANTDESNFPVGSTMGSNFVHTPTAITLNTTTIVFTSQRTKNNYTWMKFKEVVESILDTAGFGTPSEVSFNIASSEHLWFYSANPKCCKENKIVSGAIRLPWHPSTVNNDTWMYTDVNNVHDPKYPLGGHVLPNVIEMGYTSTAITTAQMSIWESTDGEATFHWDDD